MMPPIGNQQCGAFCACLLENTLALEASHGVMPPW